MYLFAQIDEAFMVTRAIFDKLSIEDKKNSVLSQILFEIQYFFISLYAICIIVYRSLFFICLYIFLALSLYIFLVLNIYLSLFFFVSFNLSFFICISLSHSLSLSLSLSFSLSLSLQFTQTHPLLLWFMGKWLSQFFQEN